MTAASGFCIGKNACAQLESVDGGSVLGTTWGDSRAQNQPQMPCSTPAAVTATVIVASKSGVADSSSSALSRRAGRDRKPPPSRCGMWTLLTW